VVRGEASVIWPDKRLAFGEGGSICNMA
jgi:hypothetical protein